MKYRALIGGVVGIGLAAWLLNSYGVGPVLDVLRSAGWTGVLAVVAIHPFQMIFSALGWREISASNEVVIRLPTYLWLRWIREAVNNLLPLAQVGGEFVVVRLLRRRGVKLAAAIAGTVADLSLEMASQILFTLLGLLLLLRNAGDSAIAHTMFNSLGAVILLMAALFASLKIGAADVVERRLLRIGRFLGWKGSHEVEGMVPALRACYRPLRRTFRSLTWHLISWLLGGIEVCVALHFLGQDVDVGSGLVIESIGQALKAVGFAVPGAIGIQEAGYVIVCRVFGLSPETAISLSLLKRLREVILGVPALVYWQHVERTAAMRLDSAPETLP